MAATQRICGFCRKPLPRNADVRRRYCGGTCKAARCNEQAKADGRFDEWTENTQRRGRQPVRAAQCVVCGGTMETRHSRRKYCSNRCGAKASYQSRKSTPEYKAQRLGFAQRRRARKRTQGEIEVFDSVEIFMRDRYRCHLCGLKCVLTERVPHPLAPTLDHLIPLAHGGAHTRANVATACFRCNSVKGARGGGEQLAVI